MSKNSIEVKNPLLFSIFLKKREDPRHRLALVCWFVLDRGRYIKLMTEKGDVTLTHYSDYKR